MPRTGEGLYENIYRSGSMGEESDQDLTTDVIHHEMEVLEPYTAGNSPRILMSRKTAFASFCNGSLARGRFARRNPSRTRLSGFETHQFTSVQTVGTDMKSNFTTSFCPQSSFVPAVENRYSEGDCHS